MNVAFIPVRGGSKSIPLKNIKLFCGKPLVYWILKAAYDCHYIDKIYVSTDSILIWDTIKSIKSEFQDHNKIEIIKRSQETASDNASTESAMLEFSKNFDFENIVLIQATSPLLSSYDLDRGFEIYLNEDVDSVLSVVKQKRFNWNYNDRGYVIPTNYDYMDRPRRQEFNGYLVENGAFYINSKKNLNLYKNRICGKIKAVEMEEDTYFEIDEPQDWEIIENLMYKRLNGLVDNNNQSLMLSNIKMVLTDCDGCLTDGGMYYSEFGDELKKFNTKDGMAFEILRKKGILVGIVTSEDMQLNNRRAKKLKVDIMIGGCKNKLEAVTKLCKKYEINLENILYVGDDINDLEIMKVVGFSCCPADAIDDIKKNATYVTNAKGGQGVIREITQLLIRND